MLKLGSSKPWPEALEQIAGTQKIDAQALLDYFKPLHDWLIEQNEGDVIGWEEECPDGSFISKSGTVPTSISVAVFVIYLLVPYLV